MLLLKSNAINLNLMLYKNNNAKNHSEHFFNLVANEICSKSIPNTYDTLKVSMFPLGDVSLTCCTSFGIVSS